MLRSWAVSSLALLIIVGPGYSDEAETAKSLEKAGAKLGVNDKQPEKPVVTAILWGPTFKPEMLKDLKEFKSLQKLRIGGPWITEDAIRELKDIKTLEVLEVRGPKVTDAVLKELQEALPKIKIRRAAPGETPFAEPKSP